MKTVECTVVNTEITAQSIGELVKQLKKLGINKNSTVNIRAKVAAINHKVVSST